MQNSQQKLNTSLTLYRIYSLTMWSYCPKDTYMMFIMQNQNKVINHVLQNIFFIKWSTLGIKRYRLVIKLSLLIEYARSDNSIKSCFSGNDFNCVFCNKCLINRINYYEDAAYFTWRGNKHNHKVYDLAINVKTTGVCVLLLAISHVLFCVAIGIFIRERSISN